MGGKRGTCTREYYYTTLRTNGYYRVLPLVVQHPAHTVPELEPSSTEYSSTCRLYSRIVPYNGQRFNLHLTRDSGVVTIFCFLAAITSQ
jgi:hypothetical protein